MEESWISQCEWPPRNEKWIRRFVEVEGIILESNFVENWVGSQLSIDWSTVSIQDVRTVVDEALDMFSRKPRSGIRIKRIDRAKLVG